MGNRFKILTLGPCLYFCPPLFSALAGKWFPGEFGGTDRQNHEQRASIVRTRFWRAVAIIALVICGVLLVQWWRLGGLSLDARGWLRVIAVFIALTAALGRGGWLIQSWKDNTVVERIDSGMYTLGQLGAAALLLFVLTL